MSTPSSELYTIFCVVLGEDTPFPVEISNKKTAGVLKDMIKQKKEIKDTTADKLTLYHVELADDINLAENAKEKMKESRSPLRATMVLAEIFNGTPKKDMVHILVHHPSLALKRKRSSSVPEGREHPSLAKTPPKRRDTPLPVLDTTPPKYQPPDTHSVKVALAEFIEKIRPQICKFLTTRPVLPVWTPPESVDEATRNFYSRLEIPVLNGEPSLLLHGLGREPDPNAQSLFRSKNHQIFSNTSGSGKTRVLFEGLCQHWGFYFVAAQGTDRIGVRDLETMIQRMSTSDKWVYNIFDGRPSEKEVHTRNCNNEDIAFNRIDKAMLARWTIFRAFIGVARELGMALNQDLRRDWLLFQAVPRLLGDIHPFLALINECLVGVTMEQLTELRCSPDLTPKRILGDALDPNTESFFYVLDEAQAASTEHGLAFADATSTTSRPVLRPIIRNWTRSAGIQNIQIILSGTGFSLELAQEVTASGQAKTGSWDTIHATGDFVDQEVQRSYLSRYLQQNFLFSPSGRALVERVHEWLRGRHRFTARYIEELIKGEWKNGQPAAPHGLLNAFVHAYCDFTPLDCESALLKAEPSVGQLSIQGLNWKYIERKPKLLEELANSIYRYMTTGKYPMWFREHQRLVEFGVAQFVEEEHITVREPLALMSIVRYFETRGHTIEADVRARMQVNQGLAFEEATLLALTKLFRHARPLNEVFRFHGSTPEWARSTAQIVLRNTKEPPSTMDVFDIVTQQPVKPSAGVAFYAKGPRDVKLWMESGNSGWCIPGNLMGPDLMTWLRLDSGQLLLLLIQAKCYLAGNQNLTLHAEVTAKAIESLNPDGFFASLKKPTAKDDIRAMLHVINKPNELFTDGEYNILRVVAAYPFEADFDSKSRAVQTAIGKSRHPLATLEPSVLTSSLASGDAGILTSLIAALECARAADKSSPPEDGNTMPPQVMIAASPPWKRRGGGIAVGSDEDVMME